MSPDQVSLKSITLDSEGDVSVPLIDDGYGVWHQETRLDRACNHGAVALLGLLALLSLCCTIGGSSLLSSIAGKPFSHCLVLYAVGAAATTVGVCTLAGSVALGWKLHHGDDLSAYGACFFPRFQSSAKKALRVLITGVVPFLASCVVLGLTVGSIALYTLSTTVAPIDRNYYSIAGLDGVIELSRDASGLTHVVAGSRRDALFGQGFAQAQDRLWQLEFQRLAGRGRLAEFVGKPGLKTDKQTRTLNLVQSASELCSYATDAERILLQSYVNGINHYLSAVNERPPEFMFMSKRLLFFHEPEPFVVDDVCIAARLLQWQLSFNVNVEVTRFKIFWGTNRSYDEIEELYMNQTNISHTIFTPEQLGLTEEDAVNARAREANDAAIERDLYNSYMSTLRSTLGGGVEYSGSDDDSNDAAEQHRVGSAEDDVWDFFKWKQQHASNAWAARAAGPATSACGASDPHLNINLPSVWYYSHLAYPANDSDAASPLFEASGVGMVGIPGVHIGKTSHVSWGITMSLTDLEDLFVLVPDPQQPESNYLVNGSSVTFTPRQETILVKGESAVVLEVQDSLYGPVATAALGLPAVLKVAIWSRVLRPDSTSLSGVMSFGDPANTNVRELRDNVFAMFQSPGFSIPMEDAEGNVGYSMTGLHVLRHVGHTGKYPTLGNGSFDHQGEIPFTELPTIILNHTIADSNTSPLMMSAANQKIYPDGYRYSLGYDYVYPFRGGRIQVLLSSNVSALSDRMFHKAVQSDLHSNVWAMMRSWIESSAEFKSLLSAQGVSWLDELTTVWDGRSTIGSPHPSFVFLWIRELSAVPSDVTRALDVDYWSPGNNYPYAMLSAPTPRMLAQCGGSCTAFAAAAFNQLASAYPQPSSAPQWGTDLNTLTGRHLMMHGTILACMFERSIPKDGDYSTIDVSDFASALQGSMAPHAASSMRQLYDWSQPSSVLFALPGGDSGNPYSNRYDNLLQAFGDDVYVDVQVAGGTPNLTASSQKLSPFPQQE